MIGVFGGTFDPIHNGHLRTALDVQQALGFSELRLLPLNLAVHREQPHASGAQRRSMVEAAVANEPSFRVDDRELSRPGPSYTVETLIALRYELGDCTPICLLVGGDAFNGFFDWHRPREILNLAHLIVMQRPGASLQRDPDLRGEVERRRAEHRDELERSAAGHIWFEPVTQLDISSTRIRRMLAVGSSPRYLLPDAVLELIEREGLYRSSTNRKAPFSGEQDGPSGAYRTEAASTEFETANPEGK